MPYEPEPEPKLDQDASEFETQRLAFQAAREVRHTVIRVITAHLNKDAAVSWQGLNLDFTAVVFDGGDFSGARFSGGYVNFSGARFSGGRVSFAFAVFSGGAVSFDGTGFSGGTVDFSDANDWSTPPKFPWTDTPPAGVKLPATGGMTASQPH